MTRFTEAVQIMKLLWTEPKASFHGRYWNFDDVSMEPKPMQKPHLPIMFGGHHENALRRAVKYANGWMGAGSSSPDSFIRESARIRAVLAEAKRDPATFISPNAFTWRSTTTKRAASGAFASGLRAATKMPISAPEVSIWGSAAKCTEKIQEIVKAGAQHIVFNPMFDETEHLEICAKEIMPHL